MTSRSLPSVLLLSESEPLAALDRRALRDAGVARIRVLTSGIQAARILAGLASDSQGFQPDIIVCGQKLADMDGEQFCAILRLHPRLLAMPILLILPNDSEVEQLRTLGCGASALLGRPYSVTALRDQLVMLAASQPRLTQLQQAARYADTKAFDAALSTYGILLKPVRQPEDYFRVGMQCLQQNRWNNAINAFQRALRNAQIKGEAELGMAVAWKGKGDLSRFRAWLAKAAATFVRARRWHRARAAYARLLQDDPSAKSPFLSQARHLMRQGHYDEAADTLAQGFEVTPKVQVCDKIAQTCLSADEPERMLRALEASLGRAMGARGNRLSDDIRDSLDALAREQEARRRQAAAERQWKVSRLLAGQKESGEEAEAASPPENSPENAPENAAETGSQADAPEQTAAKTPAKGRPRTNQIIATSVPTPEEGAARASLDLRLDDFPEADGRDQRTDSRSDDARGAAQADQAVVLAPLTEAEATSGLFTERPRLNELLSVMKLTWKLVRRDKQAKP